MPRSRKREKGDRAEDGRRLYSLGDIAKITGAPRPKSQYWIKHSLIVPDYPGTGTGNHSGFTFRNLVEFQIAERLSWVAFPLEAMRVALATIRVGDDWYAEMPRMRAAMSALDSPGAKAPSKEQGLAWLEESERIGGSGKWTDPAYLLHAERHLEATGLFEVIPESLQQKMDVEANRWREFRDPASRKSGEHHLLLVCSIATAFLTTSPDALYKYVAHGVPATVLDLTTIFTGLELRTGDHWTKVDGN